MPRSETILLSSLLLTGIAPVAGAQWTNRYPKNAGYAHHVYLEGYELPTLAAGVLDPAPSPDGRSIAFSSRGWLWQLDLATGEARRLTSGGGVDTRPAWSPDGRSLAFVRDDGRTLAVMVRDLAEGGEREIDRGMALDPAFAPDGRSLYYAAQSSGDLDIWRADLSSGQRTRVTTSDAGLELRPVPLAGGQRLVYVAKPRGGQDEVRVRTLGDSAEKTLVAGNIISQMRPAASPDGTLLAYSWPGPDGWELRLTSLERPGVSVLLVHEMRGRPLTPAWSADGRWIYYTESDHRQVMHLRRVGAGGGKSEEVVVKEWRWQTPAPTGRLTIRTTVQASASPARLNVVDAAGHPLIADEGLPRFEGQTGSIYLYSPGSVELTVPAGAVTVRAVHGLSTPEQVVTTQVAAGESKTVDIALTPLWNAQAAGWYSADHHFHINYGGQFDLAPGDLVPLMRGEDLDVATPLLANLHNRFDDQEYWAALRVDSGAPLIRFAQEVRPHFLGHIALIGARDLFWPWVWGPGYEVYGRDDRASAEAIAFARSQGGLGTYVHPVMKPGPFATNANASLIPVGIIPDVVLGAVDLIEVACIWSDERGTTDLWYRFLNLGIPIAPEGGTDAMTDFHRTPALGTTRVYVRTNGPLTFASYMEGLREGRSFVTTGPLLDVTIDGKQPGDVIVAGGKSVPFRIALHSAVAVDSVHVIVNGAPVWTGPGVDSSGTRVLTGNVRIPAGGWVAVRATGPATTRWPAMDSYAFAHTAPVWIGRRGSTDATAERASAQELLRVLTMEEARLVAGYQGAEIPRLREHFAKAKAELERRAGSSAAKP